MARPSVPTRRADILAAARDAFVAKGFAATRMEDIARPLGLSKAALYLQFPSKQALFEALISETIEAMLPQALPAEFGDSSAEALLRGMIGFVAERLADPAMAFVPRVIIGEGMNFPELARYYHDHVIARGIAMLEGLVRHGIARGEFACADPRQAARTVIGGVLIGAIWRQTFEPVGAERLEIPAMAAAHADTVIEGLKMRKQAA